METMKRKWGKPVTEVQQFRPQEFCIICDEQYRSKWRIYAPWYESNDIPGWQPSGNTGLDTNGVNQMDWIDVVGEYRNVINHKDQTTGDYYPQGGEPNYRMVIAAEKCKDNRGHEYPVGTIFYKNWPNTGAGQLEPLGKDHS